MYFVVYSAVCRELSIPVAHFFSMDEAEAYIREAILDDVDEGCDPGEYYVVEEDSSPDYMAV
jgi:hypothetical protein